MDQSRRDWVRCLRNVNCGVGSDKPSNCDTVSFGENFLPVEESKGDKTSADSGEI